MRVQMTAWCLLSDSVTGSRSSLDCADRMISSKRTGLDFFHHSENFRLDCNNFLKGHVSLFCVQYVVLQLLSGQRPSVIIVNGIKYANISKLYSNSIVYWDSMFSIRLRESLTRST